MKSNKEEGVERKSNKEEGMEWNKRKTGEIIPE